MKDEMVINTFLGLWVGDSAPFYKGGWQNPRRYYHVRARKSERRAFGIAIARASKRAAGRLGNSNVNFYGS